MKFRIIIIALGVGFSGCTRSVVDRPIHAARGEQLNVRLKAVTLQLPKIDQWPFATSVHTIRAHFCETMSVTEEEKERLFTMAFDGMTPRQILLLGGRLCVDEMAQYKREPAKRDAHGNLLREDPPPDPREIAFQMWDGIYKRYGGNASEPPPKPTTALER